MVDLADVTVETFAPHVGSRFTVRVDGADGAGQELALELIEASQWPAPPGDLGRPPFALLFVGPAEPALPQSIHPLAHPELGPLELFLVPVGRRAAGIEYESIFT